MCSCDDNYRFIVSNGKYTAIVERTERDEINTLSQIFTYLDSISHKVALMEAGVYEDCLDITRYLMMDNIKIREI